MAFSAWKVSEKGETRKQFAWTVSDSAEAYDDVFMHWFAGENESNDFWLTISWAVGESKKDDQCCPQRRPC